MNIIDLKIKWLNFYYLIILTVIDAKGFNTLMYLEISKLLLIRKIFYLILNIIESMIFTLTQPWERRYEH